MSTELAKSVADRLRIADERMRRSYRRAAAGMTAIVIGLVAICVATGSWSSLAVVGIGFVPVWMFVAYRTLKLPGRHLVERAITRPDSITSILKIVTPRSRILGLELGPEMLALRFANEDELDEARSALAALAPDASVVPPLTREPSGRE